MCTPSSFLSPHSPFFGFSSRKCLSSNPGFSRLLGGCGGVCCFCGGVREAPGVVGDWISSPIGDEKGMRGKLGGLRSKRWGVALLGRDVEVIFRCSRKGGVLEAEMANDQSRISWMIIMTHSELRELFPHVRHGSCCIPSKIMIEINRYECESTK